MLAPRVDAVANIGEKTKAIAFFCSKLLREETEAQSPRQSLKEKFDTLCQKAHQVPCFAFDRSQTLDHQTTLTGRSEEYCTTAPKLVSEELARFLPSDIPSDRIAEYVTENLAKIMKKGGKDAAATGKTSNGDEMGRVESEVMDVQDPNGDEMGRVESEVMDVQDPGTNSNGDKAKEVGMGEEDVEATEKGSVRDAAKKFKKTKGVARKVPPFLRFIEKMEASSPTRFEGCFIYVPSWEQFSLQVHYFHVDITDGDESGFTFERIRKIFSPKEFKVEMKAKRSVTSFSIIESTAMQIMKTLSANGKIDDNEIEGFVRDTFQPQIDSVGHKTPRLKSTDQKSVTGANKDSAQFN